MAHLYRFYIGGDNKTGKVDVDAVEKLAGELFKTGATVLKARGLWNERREECVIVEIVRKEKNNLVEYLARVFADAFQQDCVMVVHHEVDREFVSCTKRSE